MFHEKPETIYYILELYSQTLSCNFIDRIFKLKFMLSSFIIGTTGLIFVFAILKSFFTILISYRRFNQILKD